MAQLISIEEATSKIHDGMTVMVGGFLATGTPVKIIEALVAQKVKGLTYIGNDTGVPGDVLSQLVAEHCLKKFIGSFIGMNKETHRQMNSGELEVQLVPQGTLVERIRAAGAGLGGFLTPTGVGTVVEEGKQKIEVGGKTYLLELPLSADVALIKAYKADLAGNLVYRRSARNFNPMMAMAATTVIAQVDEVVDIGVLDPDEVMTPGIFVDYLVLAHSQEVSCIG